MISMAGVDLVGARVRYWVRVTLPPLLHLTTKLTTTHANNDSQAWTIIVVRCVNIRSGRTSANSRKWAGQDL